MNDNKKTLSRLDSLIDIGLALSAERDTTKLIEMILLGAKNLTHADGGTIYLLEDEKLHFEVMQTTSLGFDLGGTTGEEIPYPPLPLFDMHGEPNNHMVAVYSVHNDESVNIEDAYTSDEFDFSGMRDFDKKTGFHSRSFLTIPMKNHENKIIGVLQLINAIDSESGDVIPFSKDDQKLVESLSSQAAIALTNQELIQDQRVLFESFIEVIAGAIDEKSPYTGGHCRRVPQLGLMLVNAMNDVDQGPFANTKFTEQEIYEFNIAALLHDCGKITTPIHVVDKATKLETIYDRINVIDTRFEILHRDADIEFLEQKIAAMEAGGDVYAAINQADKMRGEKKAQYNEDREFIRHCNIGGEFMAADLQIRVRDIAKYTWKNDEGEIVSFLTGDEVYNINIEKGTLTQEERDIVNHHIISTINMLEALPFPDHLKNVAEIAGGHHERMDGKGYPKGLKRTEMSIQARAMGVADIFEALTAADRPYKKGMSLSTALSIMGRMKLDSHIDPDLFDLFISEKIYLEYAKTVLTPDQIDEIDLSKIPGYEPLKTDLETHHLVHELG